MKAKLKWTLKGHPGEVLAFTKSEARAIFKKKLGVERLPVGAKVVRIE